MTDRKKGRVVESSFQLPDPLSSIDVESAFERDWFLQSLVVLSDRGMELDITLSSAGSIISGTLISGKKFFTELSDTIRDADVDEDESNTLEAVATAWAGLAGFYDANDASHEEDEGDIRPLAPGFIHLRSAKIYAPSGKSIPSTEEGMLWRGMLSKIDGFSVGSFTPE